MIIKPNWNKFKEKFLIIDNFFKWFKNTEIGKHYLKGTSFFKILFFFGSILVAQISAMSNLISLTSKVETQLFNSEGFVYIGWFILSLIIPEGNPFLIIILLLILLGAFIIKYKESKERTIEDSLLKSLRAKAKTLLFEIQTSIKYSNQTIVIDRDDVINDITKKLKNKQIIILSGIGGVGKTSVIKQIYEEREDKSAFYLFRGSEFKNRDLIKDYSLQEFMEAHEKIEDKVVIIDSAEKLFDDIDEEFFKEFLSSLIRNEWKVIFTIRDSYLDMLNYQFIEVYELKPFHIHINNLNIEELSNLAKEFDFILPTDEKLIELIKNPFYLHEYLLFYHENRTIDYKAFKNKLWDKKINKPNTDREDCFLDLARKRAVDGQFFISDIECKSGSLKELKKDGILGKETAGYFITHDIYEEWALEKIIDREFYNRKNNEKFFKKIGSSLPIRRSFRNWVSEQLLLDNKVIKPFIENIIDDIEIEQFWKDEVFVSVLLSDYSDTFFEIFERELLADDYTLLKRISFLLRVACKEADDSHFKQSNLNIAKEEIFSMFNKPKGNGWKSFIAFVYKHINTIKFKNINKILPILYDWNLTNKKGETTRLASLIVLKYYKWINQGQYSYDEHINKICNIIISGTIEIQEELKLIFDEIIKNKWKDNRDNYYKLSIIILSTSNGLPRALPILRNMPEYVLKLADLFWMKEINNTYSLSDAEEIEDAYGLDNIFELQYFSSSAYETPIYYMLKTNFSNTIDFLLEFINKSVEKYAKSGWEDKFSGIYSKFNFETGNIKEIVLQIDDKITVKQYHSQALWDIYRGTSSPVSPYLLQSIHMALEKYLLEIAKDMEHENLENLLFPILIKSKSSSVSAVIASVVLANSSRTINIALALFRTKEFIYSDLIRNINDGTVQSQYTIGYGLNQSSKIYNDERIQTCEDKHRKNHLEQLFLQYQYYQFFDEKKVDKNVY